ncbi:hypothetical protein L1987_58868 [Smallanthus sonchifolius]|uniref:Uncharacterized protein n=1 Tax=Smallanthus sonchifolius TaxID=185202 RepID=A0ACB9D3Q1_9ASTR|nr:hypothetical protein L1987_58868 [Smallanthus sonchifolius]
MNQRVPNWDLEDVNPNHDIYKLDCEVAEITWENGQLALHELGSRRVPTKSQPITSWDQPRAAETLEALVNQATLQPYCKTDTTFNDNELVRWMHYNNPTVTVNLNNQSTTMTSDALVPNSNNRTSDGSAQAQRSIKSTREAGCSTRASSCSGNPFMDPRVTRGTTSEAYNWSSGRDMSVSGTFVTPDAYTGDLGGRRLTSTSTGSPENTNTSSGRDCSNSTFPDHTACHRRTQRETKAVTEKKKEKGKSSMLNKRRRTAAIHNLSERKRRDKINQKLKTLQKLVPNSSKTDKASMLDEVIEHIKQLQLQVHTTNMMNMSPMMMSLVMQQQLQFQKYMMNSMGMGMGMGNIQPRFHPSAFMPSWNNQATDQVVNTNTMPVAPMPAFLAPRNQPPNMESYSRMAALYQQMQNQPCGPFPKN